MSTTFDDIPHCLESPERSESLKRKADSEPCPLPKKSKYQKGEQYCLDVQLWDAAARGDLSKVILLLNQGADPNRKIVLPKNLSSPNADETSDSMAPKVGFDDLAPDETSDSMAPNVGSDDIKLDETSSPNPDETSDSIAPNVGFDDIKPDFVTLQ